MHCLFFCLRLMTVVTRYGNVCCAGLVFSQISKVVLSRMSLIRLGALSKRLNHA